MAKRGRPPHPDILTPREWEVHALLCEGLSNEAIAERLAISLAGAKYHVSEILSKLGVASREEAAAWTRDQRPWWRRGFAPFAALWPKAGASWLSIGATGLVAIAIVAGFGLLVWGVVRTGGNEAPPGPAITEPLELGSGIIGGFDWSQDGRSLAFSIDGVLYRADAPAFQPQLLVETDDEQRTFSSPRWSPGADRIAILGSHDGRGGAPDDRSDTIWVVNADGSGLRDLLPGEAAELSVSTAKVMQDWLDEDTIAFDEHCGTACQQPYLLDVETGEVEQAVRFPDVSTGSLGAGMLGTVYYYSPNLRWLAVEGLGGLPTVLTYNFDSQELIRLEEQVRRSPWQWFDAWAPDSSAFLFSQAETDNSGVIPPFSLLRYDIETRRERVLATPGKDGAWSADGSLIAYVTESTEEQPCGGAEAEHACTAVMDVGSGEEQYRIAGPAAFALEAGEDNLPAPVFLPDDRLLYITPEGNLGLAAGKSTSVLFVGVIIDLAIAPEGRSVIVAEPSRLTVVPIPPL